MELSHNGHPRIVITGMAAISSLGQRDAYWENLKNGVSGIKKLEHLDLEHLNVHIGSYCYDFEPTDFIDKKEARRVGRPGQLILAVTQLLLKDSGLSEEELERDAERTGVSVGSGLGSFEILAEASHEYMAGIRYRPGPFALSTGLSNMPAHYVSRETKAVGPIWPVPTACAAGSQAFVQGIDLIRAGHVDRVFVAGVESTMHEYALAGFDSMTVLARDHNDDPTRASRPFDAERGGFVYGEGAAAFVVETLEKAQERGATLYAEVLGGASSSDAFHVAALDPEAQGMTRCMKWALESAHLNPEQIDYINAHGTGTIPNDKLETLGIKKVFGETAYQIPVSSSKSMIGHCMGAAGALEAVACVKTLQEQVIHPTINYENPDPDCDLDYVPNVARDAEVNYVLSNNFGLGGQNASVVFGRI
jgi:beta-ketoacyl-acyl-carrier-protein synthase II